MIGMHFAAERGDNMEYCGYDFNEIHNMMKARAGLMASLYNSSRTGIGMMRDDGPLGR